LLGAGESGKSTIAKQMKIIHLNGFTPAECESYREIIYSNILSSIKTLAIEAKKRSLSIQDEARLDKIRQINSVDEISNSFNDIKGAWNEPSIHEVWKVCNEFQLIDSARYFYDNLDRISAKDFKPTVDDVLHSRQMTTGISEIEWTYKDLAFKMTDVGGQRNHRSKWIHCFDGVTAVIFVISLSEYDQVLREDESTNRMHESITLFESLINSEWFYKTNFIIFFNKKDLFEQKIKTKDLKVCFPEYSGGCNAEAAKQYIATKFEELNHKRHPQRLIYHHFTCATDTTNIRAVFADVRDILLKGAIGSVF